MSIKAKQVAGVTTLVVLVVAGMTAVQIASLTQLRIDETESRATTLKEAILHRAAVVVREAGTTDPYVALRDDGGLALDPAVRGDQPARHQHDPLRRHRRYQGPRRGAQHAALEGQPIPPLEP